MLADTLKPRRCVWGEISHPPAARCHSQSRCSAETERGGNILGEFFFVVFFWRSAWRGGDELWHCKDNSQTDKKQTLSGITRRFFPYFYAFFFFSKNRTARHEKLLASVQKKCDLQRKKKRGGGRRSSSDVMTVKFLFARLNVCFNCCRQLFRNSCAYSYWKTFFFLWSNPRTRMTLRARWGQDLFTPRFAFKESRRNFSWKIQIFPTETRKWVFCFLMSARAEKLVLGEREKNYFRKQQWRKCNFSPPPA